MKIMSNLSSTRLRAETPHISDALKRRAQSVINNKSIDAQTRAVIRYGLETNDPWLPQIVRCVDAGESIIDNLYVHSSEEKIEALTDLICRAGDESSAALLVLLATLENSPHPKALANTAKHLAFTRCGELKLYGMIDAQIAIFEDKLIADKMFMF
jgi:hypothetical protein